MATPEQVTAVKDFHESNDRTLAGWDATGEGAYQYAGKDPYELAHANKKLNEAVSVLITGTDTITVDGGTTDLTGTVTLWSTLTNEDVIWTIAAGTTSATIDQDGIITASGEDGGNGEVIATATSISNSTISDALTVTISNQATA